MPPPAATRHPVRARRAVRPLPGRVREDGSGVPGAGRALGDALSPGERPEHLGEGQTGAAGGQHGAPRTPSPSEPAAARVMPIGGAMLEELGSLRLVPEWLPAIARPEPLKRAIQRSIPELASGRVALEHVEPGGIRLEDGVWRGR